MELIGVTHVGQNLEEIDRYISNKYPEGLESLMVELPQNWPELQGQGFSGGFFGELARRYEGRGARIIYGDRGRKIPNVPSLFWILTLSPMLTPASI